MNNIQKENIGIAEVHKVCAKMNAIWRPTTNNDLGIDGQIEFLECDSVVSTGKFVAVQVKSGVSYFENIADSKVKFYPEQKHRAYWGKIDMPVILILHNPDTDLTIYTIIKKDILDEGPILLDENEKFTTNAREKILVEFEVKKFLQPPEFNATNVLKKFKNVKLDYFGTTITGIDFLLACTDRDKKYFELRYHRLHSMISYKADCSCVQIGNDFDDFILRCVNKVLIHQIAESFEESFEFMWFDLMYIPDTYSNLTVFGEMVIDELWLNIDYFVGIPNSYIYAETIYNLATKVSEKIDKSDKLADVVR